MASPSLLGLVLAYAWQPRGSRVPRLEATPCEQFQRGQDPAFAIAALAGGHGSFQLRMSSLCLVR